jgi:hypothetical protein
MRLFAKLLKVQQVEGLVNSVYGDDWALPSLVFREIGGTMFAQCSACTVEKQGDQISS